MRILGGSLNAVTLVKCYESRNHVYLVMELCTGGNLLQKLSSDGALEEQFAARIMTDILRMAYQVRSGGPGAPRGPICPPFAHRARPWSPPAPFRRG